MIQAHPVSFGNPALGVYHGTVYTSDNSQDESSLHETINMVAMIHVPPEQVPEGVLNVTRAHRPWMRRVRIVISQDDEERTYLVLLELSSAEAVQTMVQELHHTPYTCLDESQVCHVYSVVSVQGHEGVSLVSPFFARGRSDDYHCAVCLEHMDETTDIFTTVCNHSFHIDCLIQWQDSPCPVCRYDHAGLKEALSQCHQCGTTDHNYVCLICGIVACGGIPSTTACHRSTPEPTPRTTSHAQKHYDETLHAYALDTITQHVWDFAGQGYVHRLLQNKQDGKLVEISDPNNTSSQERSNHPPAMSDAQEGEMVHRKLEGYASQYYTLLKSQLEQQRIFYQGRLEELRHEFRPRPQAQDVLLALKQERQQLGQRLHSVQARYQKVHDNLKFLRNMNESLEANQKALQQEMEQARREQMEVRQKLESVLPPLQEQVTRLMLQLEHECETAS
jgi:BRCA1-associated protein